MHSYFGDQLFCRMLNVRSHTGSCIKQDGTIEGYDVDALKKEYKRRLCAHTDLYLNL